VSSAAQLCCRAQGYSQYQQKDCMLNVQVPQLSSYTLHSRPRIPKDLPCSPYSLRPIGAGAGAHRTPFSFSLSPKQNLRQLPINSYTLNPISSSYHSSRSLQLHLIRKDSDTIPRITCTNHAYDPHFGSLGLCVCSPHQNSTAITVYL
jgi:hypothetical protein